MIEPASAPALFDALRDLVARVHVPSRNVVARWGAPLGRESGALRAEFARARTDDQLRTALFHLINALHNDHLAFAYDGDGRIFLDVTVGVAWDGERPEFVVRRVGSTLADALRVGDRVVAVDGQPLDDTAWGAFQVGSSDPTRIAEGVARYLRWRPVSSSAARVGTTTRWSVVGVDGTRRDVVLTWGVRPRAQHAEAGCAEHSAEAYGPYALVASGLHVCVYASSDPRYAPYPVVRHDSFLYDDTLDRRTAEERVRADRELIAAALAARPHRAVVLDVRDNAGGNEPDWFLDMYGSAPYEDLWFQTRVVPFVTTRRALGAFNYRDDAFVREYLARGADVSGFTRLRPFFCGDTPDCRWSNRYTPSHRITDRPIVLLIGPGCMSACDTFAWHFHRSHAGTIVGMRHFAAVTIERLALHVRSPWSGATLGTIELAVSRERDADGTEVEGAELRVDRMLWPTRARLDQYPADLVRAAIESVERTDALLAPPTDAGVP